MDRSRRTVLVALAALLALAAVGAGGYIAGAAFDNNDDQPIVGEPIVDRVAPGVSECGNSQPAARPKSIILTCADGGVTVEKVRWRTWGSTLAFGSATVTANSCEPTCAEGSPIDYPVTVVLDRVIENGAGQQFTRATAIYADKTPNVDGSAATTYDLPTSKG